MEINIGCCSKRALFREHLVMPQMQSMIEKILCSHCGNHLKKTLVLGCSDLTKAAQVCTFLLVTFPFHFRNMTSAPPPPPSPWHQCPINGWTGATPLIRVAPLMYETATNLIPFITRLGGNTITPSMGTACSHQAACNLKILNTKPLVTTQDNSLAVYARSRDWAFEFSITRISGCKFSSIFPFWILDIFKILQLLSQKQRYSLTVILLSIE